MVSHISMDIYWQWKLEKLVFFAEAHLYLSLDLLFLIPRTVCHTLLLLFLYFVFKLQ